MPTIRFSLLALLASLAGFAWTGWIFHGGPEAPHGIAAKAARAPERRTSATKASKTPTDTTTHNTGAGHETLEFDCAPRVRDAPFDKGGAPVQYIDTQHAGVTEVWDILKAIGKSLHDKTASHAGWVLDPPGCKAVKGSLHTGKVYTGHAPLGWCAAQSPVRPLYIISLREPVSRLVSTYDFVATSPRSKSVAGHLHDAEKRLEQQGTRSTEFLEHLFLANDTEVSQMVALSQVSWLLPGDCSALLVDPRSRLAVALKNLLRCDIVVDPDRLRDSLFAQLWYHAPQTEFLKTEFLKESKHANVPLRSKQVLSDATIEKMLQRRSSSAVDGTDADLILYSFAQRVARAREHRARACWGREGLSWQLDGLGRDGVNCSALCAINVTSAEFDLVRSAPSVEQCSPDSIHR